MKWLDSLTKKPSAAPEAPNYAHLEELCSAFGPDQWRLFDVDYYLGVAGDDNLTAETAFEHFMTEGWKRRLNPSEIFDAVYYLETQNDVRMAGMNPLQHFVEHGFSERRPMSRSGPPRRAAVVTADAPKPEVVLRPERRYYGSDNALSAFNDRHFVRQYEFMVGKLSEQEAETPSELYYTRAAARKLSPNPEFDELWYISEYADVKGAVEAGDCPSGFSHFCDIGWYEGRMPSARWAMATQIRQKAAPEDNAAALKLLEDDDEGAAFLEAFPFIKAYDFCRYVGLPARMIQLRGVNTKPLMAARFDADFYTKQAEAAGLRVGEDAFEHYYTVGCVKGLSPNAEFDEAFYLAFYKDIRGVVAEGLLLCGYEHFMLSGRREGRLPKHDLKRALEVSIPGVTQPSLLHRMPDLEHRLAEPKVEIDAEAPKTFWIVLPRLDPDIAFGGYRALFELVVALREHKDLKDYAFKCLLTEVGQANPEYFLFQTPQKHITDCFRDIECVCFDADRTVIVNADDYFLAYSTWDALIATKLAADTRHPRIIHLVQEYEPIFHDYNSHHAISNSGFSVPAFHLFNSKLLLDYFEKGQLGPFSGKNGTPMPDVDYLAFEHIPTPAPLQKAKAMAARDLRTCVLYARPEGHAARNLFEIMLLALRRACEDDVFEGSWRFVGVGALSEMDDIVLTAEHKLEMVTKLPEAEYLELLGSVDIGVSLMYAPHPSVVPFELCTTGALVVVNTFTNRDEAFFLSKSQNFVPAAPTIDGVTQALKAAAARVGDFEAREKNALSLTKVKWSETFNEALISKALKGAADWFRQAPSMAAPREAAKSAKATKRAKT